MKDEKVELTLVDLLLEPNFSWEFNKDRNNQTSSVKIVKGKKQKTNNILDEELRKKKARRKKCAHNRLVKNQKERDLIKGLNNKKTSLLTGWFFLSLLKIA